MKKLILIYILLAFVYIWIFVPIPMVWKERIVQNCEYHNAEDFDHCRNIEDVILKFADKGSCKNVIITTSRKHPDNLNK